MFHLLDHPGAQQERLHLPGKASRLPHESCVCWLPRRYFNRIRCFVDHALVSSPDAVPGRITLRATARIEQPAAQHRGDAQVTALVRGGLNPCLPCVRSNKLCPFPHPLGDEALPSPLHGFTDEFGQALEGSARGERQFSLCPAHGAPWSAQGGAHLGQRRVVSRQDVPTEEAEMDEVEASLGKERGGNI